MYKIGKKKGLSFVCILITASVWRCDIMCANFYASHISRMVEELRTVGKLFY